MVVSWNDETAIANLSLELNRLYNHQDVLQRTGLWLLLLGYIGNADYLRPNGIVLLQMTKKDTGDQYIQISVFKSEEASWFDDWELGTMILV